MTQIPRSALLLGLAGLIPFLWGVITLLIPDIGAHLFAVTPNVQPRYLGVGILIIYGHVTLAFMAGVLWGFAVRSETKDGMKYYALSVLPALWSFFVLIGLPFQPIVGLIAGFLGLLWLDHVFSRAKLAPLWWMKLRLMLTGIVILCLAPGVLP